MEFLCNYYATIYDTQWKWKPAIYHLNFYVYFVSYLCIYCGISAFISFHAALACLMQTENTINGASSI